ncbi:Uma2 family endonuclease [Nodosilinea sp. LEGE 06152]|uniref:Uma2 family endonuclease n=1 Tax=Nodosilinea sp. LEGE 06152 TaxID=2777966 RepID=UPI0018818D5A|nr:Uma2 family endonuclease [Nodosilinea sp. LEGE 06152]MBE9158213.1 Uma2 family endonuclease [Nodosilinea sp. LEGE 06152]MBE9160634.1 Uma2 family endonuclease [Nodosilinea sp. LEGE 06152]
MHPPKTELFDNWLNSKPEGNLELIEGQLIVGNSLMGSRLLLRQILQGWGAEAAIALAPIETWFQALVAGYSLPLPQTGSINAQLNELESAASAIAFTPEVLSAGSVQVTWPHHRLRQKLIMDLFRLDGQVGGHSLGRDFVMRLGNNGFTPDLVFFKNQGLNQLYEAFLSGPAELVIEIVMPGHEDCDRTTKSNYYQAAGVLEYWLIDPAAQQIEFYRLDDGQYQPQLPETDGYYRPSSAPGLAFRPSALWQEETDQTPLEPDAFVVEQASGGYQRHYEAGPQWGAALFIPNIQAEPVPLCFEEYISWSPRAKFEFIDGKPLIGSTPGTRNVLAMLMMTFGLISTVKLLPPQCWIQGLRQRIEAEQRDAERKAEWWTTARQAAERLRSHFSVERLGVIGELAMAQPLNYWSDITLVHWDELDNAWQAYDLLRDLDSNLRINLLWVDEGWLTADQLWQIERHLVEL